MSRTNGQRTEDGKWKIEQCSGGPETAKCNFYKSSFEIKFAALFLQICTVQTQWEIFQCLKSVKRYSEGGI